jgi:small multidrug resistance family-3 protein
MDRDIVDQEPLVGDGEDHGSDDRGVVLGDGDLAVADDRGVVVGHRAGQHPDALDVVAVGGVDERGNARGVRLGRRPEPVAAGLVGARGQSCKGGVVALGVQHHHNVAVRRLLVRHPQPGGAGAGILTLGLYGFVATFQSDPHFGRIIAAYGGLFVAGSLAWGMAVDGFRPDRYDLAGAALCLAGVAVIMYAPRTS